ncbi:MAG: hypothetical protein M1823_004994 [Watsoniomyces obsoletus]|nr:MAG: hypothetical protein M1823_004994 [Watsoniomyces obsoletus]
MDKEGEVDNELSAKVESEIQLEKEMRDSDDMPMIVKDYLENGPFQMHDTPGKEEVVLTRTFGDEKIRIVFSIADLTDLDQDSDKYDDRALYDEDDEGHGVEGDESLPSDGQSGGAQSKGVINSGRTKNGNINVAPEDSISPADRPELNDDEGRAPEGAEEDDVDAQEPSVPIRLEVTIEKPGRGALQIETVANDGMIGIENVYYFENADMAQMKSADQELKKREMYLGPPFANLDEDLQVLFERYLDERGVNTALALFVPDYVDYKEQKEYLRWLADVKSFVDA